ncbi:general amino acid permease 1 [Stereum hirsutum FP-91666 SS1]|uniref:general amino acid permease 1 n=1 Tax=Stereum hirsutum (strain FP-91666) TaxID=721885 RepID=UPI000440CBDF|nr:general amino acid permease 1 [Stereum hirsutum FP-91666 SS1]EIM88043.1 general amino acid permease 1 [Stereum hirsutum FP-91666 SS1]
MSNDSETDLDHERLLKPELDPVSDMNDAEDSQRTDFYKPELDKVQRRLGSTHIQMLAIASVIGTGLFLAIGKTLSYTGPLGLLIVFAHVGTVAFASLASVSEMTAFAPVSGSFSHFAARWVDPALGFAVGWNYFYACAITLPAEISAAAVLVRFWDKDSSHMAAYISLFVVMVFIVNLFGARAFANTEIVFSALKLSLIAGLIIGGLIIDLGGGPDQTSHGFEYWRDPGPMVSSLEPGAAGRFLGLLLATTPAAFSMGGMEIITVAAAETKNPRKNIVTAMKTVFFRIFFCYILTAFVIGLLIPSNDPELLSVHEGSGQSPFVLAFHRAGVKVLPSIINAVVLSSAFSSANGMLYSSSRLLYALALQGQAPKWFATVTASGLPLRATLVAGSFSVLAFLNVQTEAGTVFSWFLSLSTVGGLLNWLMIGVSYLAFYNGLKAQGMEGELRGIYRSRFQPYAAIWTITWSTFFILVSGLSTIWTGSTSDFVAAYINLPIFAGLYFGWKIYKGTSIVSFSEMDFTTVVPHFQGIPAMRDMDSEDTSDMGPAANTWRMTELR